MKEVKGKIRDERYLAEIRNVGCIVCGTMPVHAHHLMRAEERGMALRTGDNWAVPLCPTHHDDLHNFGREDVWWALSGTDPMEWAEENWRAYRDRQN